MQSIEPGRKRTEIWPHLTKLAGQQQKTAGRRKLHSQKSAKIRIWPNAIDPTGWKSSEFLVPFSRICSGNQNKKRLGNELGKCTFTKAGKHSNLFKCNRLDQMKKKSKHVEFPVPTDPFKRVNIRP